MAFFPSNTACLLKHKELGFHYGQIDREREREKEREIAPRKKRVPRFVEFSYRSLRLDILIVNCYIAYTIYIYIYIFFFFKHFLLLNETDISRKIEKGNIIAKTMQNYSLLPSIGVHGPSVGIIHYFPAVIIKEKKKNKKQKQKQKRKKEKEKKQEQKREKKEKRKNLRANSEFLLVARCWLACYRKLRGYRMPD